MSPLPSSQLGYVHLFVIAIIFAAIVGLISVPILRTNNTSAASPYITAAGTKLFLHGEPYQFTGVNAYNIATYPGYNAGCGGLISDLDGFFSKLRPNTTVRMWAYQGTMATNTTTKTIDWTGLDRVVNAAQKNGKKLILVLGDQSGHCDDGHWKDKAWYGGGYKQAFNDYGNGLTPLPYLDYVKLIVARYKNSPAVAMWEPINEPETSDCTNGKKGYECYSNLVCSDQTGAAAALRSFFDVVGGTIKSIDPNHLVSSGTIGDGQCGTVFEDYKYVHESPGIDVASFHDYQRIDEPMPGDEWNGLQKRLNQMSLINKPLIVGEIGMIANDSGAGCISFSSRKDKMKAKMDAQFAAGIAGFIPWSYTGGAAAGCNYDIATNDPLLSLLKEYPVSMSIANPSPSYTPFPTPLPTPDTQPPTAPTSLTASNITSSKITLNWSGATDNKGIDRYELYKDWGYVTAVWGTTYTLTNLTPGKTYLFYIKTRDKSGNSSGESVKLNVYVPTVAPTPTPTPAPTAAPPDTQPPTAPSNITPSNLGPTSVTLNWSGATDNRGIDRYELYKDWGYLTAVWGNSYTVNNLTPGKSYLFYLKTRDKVGLSSAESIKLTVTMPYSSPTPTPTPKPSPTATLGPDTQAPTVATNLTATAVSPTEIRLNWTAATDNVRVDRYEVYRDYNYVTAVWGTSYVHSNLTPGKTYKYYLKTRDSVGNSSGGSMIVTVTTPLQ